MKEIEFNSINWDEVAIDGISYNKDGCFYILFIDGERVSVKAPKSIRVAIFDYVEDCMDRYSYLDN
jgi:hypothetical protein